MKPRFAPLVLAVTLLAGFTLALGQTQGGAENEARIASVYGRWVHVGKTDLKSRLDVKFGDPVNDSDCLYGEKDATLVVNRSKELVPYSCNSPALNSCMIPDDLKKTMICSVKIGITPTNVKKVGVWSALFDRAFNNPDKYMVAVSRGLEAGFLEAVVRLDGPQLDLSPVFKEMDDGEYWVVLTPVGGNGKPGRPLHLAYKRGAPVLVPSAGISPALYNVISVDQSSAPQGTEAWALVRSPDTFAAASSQFGQVVAASEKWPDEMDASATRAILRGYLDQLADQK